VWSDFPVVSEHGSVAAFGQTGQGDRGVQDGALRDIAEASDNLGIAALSKPITKWYLAWPRWLGM